MITRAYTQDLQGTTPGNLATMDAGDGLDAVVSSPPYLPETDRTHPHGNKATDGGPGFRNFYSNDPANIGNPQGAYLTDFWHAARQIVDQCYQVLAPGTVAVWVVKRFVRDKQIVNFPDQWRQMCEAAGFVTVEWIRAWVVEDKGTQLDLWGNGHERRVEHKSFFRRLYESKYPENAIDWEDVLIMRRVP